VIFVVVHDNAMASRLRMTIDRRRRAIQLAEFREC